MPPACAGRPGVAAAGYNYVRVEGPFWQKLGEGEPMSFVLEDRTLLESNPRVELRSFAAMLFRRISGGPLEACY